MGVNIGLVTTRWTGLMRTMTGTSSRLKWTCQWTPTFYIWQEISWLAKWLSASQKRLWSTESSWQYLSTSSHHVDPKSRSWSWRMLKAGSYLSLESKLPILHTENIHCIGCHLLLGNQYLKGKNVHFWCPLSIWSQVISYLNCTHFMTENQTIHLFGILQMRTSWHVYRWCSYFQFWKIRMNTA